MKTKKNRSKIKTFSSYDNLPKIPETLELKLEKAYSRYEHFIGIMLGRFDSKQIEEDRQKYPHLLLPEENGLPVFGGKECVEYMSKVSGISEIYCLVMVCQKENYNSFATRHLIEEIRAAKKVKRLALAIVG